jgi:hypothetical protein
VRVGIGTGLVVVGDLLGEGAAKEQTVVGEHRTLRLGCRRPRPRAASLSDPQRAGCSEASSTTATSVPSR